MIRKLTVFSRCQLCICRHDEHMWKTFFIIICCADDGESAKSVKTGPTDIHGSQLIKMWPGTSACRQPRGCSCNDKKTLICYTATSPSSSLSSLILLLLLLQLLVVCCATRSIENDDHNISRWQTYDITDRPTRNSRIKIDLILVKMVNGRRCLKTKHYRCKIACKHRRKSANTHTPKKF